MSKPVLIQDIVDALDMQSDEYSSYVDLDTGQVVTVSHEVLREVEEGEDGEEEEDAEDDEWAIAKRIARTDRFVGLPSKIDVHEWGIMQDFVHIVKLPKVRDELQQAIHGAGAFRYFKDIVRSHRIEEKWFDFRADALKDIAIGWCAEHDISWQ